MTGWRVAVVVLALLAGMGIGAVLLRVLDEESAQRSAAMGRHPSQRARRRVRPGGGRRRAPRVPRPRDGRGS